VAETVDIAVIGAGAAGLMAAIAAGRAAPRAGGESLRIVALDGAKTLGAKILVAGGGRCNVTHHAVDETAYACGPGTSRNAIRKVLRGFDVPRTVEFFAGLGVELKREETGKLFPTTDEARTVLNALLTAAADAGAEIRHPWRVGSVRRGDEGFVIEAAEGTDRQAISARRVIVATGGMALPRTGSDGQGYSIVRGLGHTITEPVFPALVPLLLDPGRTFVNGLSGLTHTATITLHSGTGKKLVEFTNSMLCTHFGVSGPAVLDISRYYLDAHRTDAGAVLSINWTPEHTFDTLDALLASARGKAVGRVVAELVPERLARALCESVGIDPAMPMDQLKRDDRRGLAHAVTRTVLPVTGDRGFTFAEVTAGGVPLSELHLDTMESRVCPGLHLCGEICDVDGRIGGFNFQWAWASGHAAGTGAARGVGVHH
jgi:predicted Rossmann fold flavoprotein